MNGLELFLTHSDWCQFLGYYRKSVTLRNVAIIQRQAVLERGWDSMSHNWNLVTLFMTLPLTHVWPWIGLFIFLVPSSFIYKRQGKTGWVLSPFQCCHFLILVHESQKSYENIQLQQSRKTTVILFNVVLRIPIWLLSLLTTQYVYLWKSTRFM
jgi:hypothetical protein